MPATVWPIEADGADPIVETFGFLTSILTARSGFEQRAQLREVSLQSIEFSIAAHDRVAQLAESLIYAEHADVLAVPLWQFGSRLTAAVGIGDSLLPIDDAEDVPYARSVDDPGLALVWLDPFTWEQFTVAGTSGAGVATSDTAVAEWPAGSMVYPVRLARITGGRGVRRLTSNVLTGRLTFSVEPA